MSTIPGCDITIAADCDRSIRLRISASTNYSQGLTNFQAFRTRIEVVDARGVDTEIFLYERHPADPTNNNIETDEFVSVASPVDMTEYPTIAPNPARDFPYLRKNYIDIIVRSTRYLEEAIAKIKGAVAILLDSLCRLDTLEVLEDLWIPGPPAESASASVSISTSASASGSGSV